MAFRSMTIASAAALVLLAGCGGGTGDSDENAAGGSAVVPKVSNDWALQYTGGTAGPADTGKSPIKVGYINQEGGAPAFPEASTGIDAAVAYINRELGGAGGHPVVLEKCVVQSEEDGQKCGTQMANDPEVKFVIEGVLTVGNKAIYSVLGGRKPIMEASPSTSDDLTAEGAYSYTPGGPGTIAGMAQFVARQLPDVRRVAVLYADNPAGKAAAEQFLEPQLKKLGVTDVKLVGVADTATGPDVAAAIQAAGGRQADTLLSFLTVPGCMATYDALQSLGVTPRVVATGLCFGTPMTKHMRDVGSEDQVPDGWYFTNFGYSYFAPDEASGMATYVAKVKQYGPKNAEYTGFAGYTFANLMTAMKFVHEIGPDRLTSEAMAKAIESFEGPMMMVAGPIECGYSPVFAALCGSQIGVEQYKDGRWIQVATPLRGNAISIAQALGG
ncbi:ABC transporter substrate-binding protein [Spirillospora sp. NPDC048824]|uniref:ABC transporter substrate-binding protein n=1 Tax=Spirillospora sp. NPDC048824 TaxID=3364526 RepID=UPI0037102E77